jgi:hypothetical protein
MQVKECLFRPASCKKWRVLSCDSLCRADLQMVNISLRVLSKPDSGVLSQIYRSLGLDWDERVLPSIGNEVLKAVVAQYNAEQLLTQRDRVSRAVSSLLFGAAIIGPPKSFLICRPM